MNRKSGFTFVRSLQPGLKMYGFAYDEAYDSEFWGIFWGSRGFAYVHRW